MFKNETVSKEISSRSHSAGAEKRGEASQPDGLFRPVGCVSPGRSFRAEEFEGFFVIHWTLGTGDCSALKTAIEVGFQTTLPLRTFDFRTGADSILRLTFVKSVSSLPPNLLNNSNMIIPITGISRMLSSHGPAVI